MQRGYGRIVIVMFALAGAMHLPAIFEAPLAGNEPQRAIVAHQMLRDGNWAVPRIFDAVYGRKPPLINWMAAACEAVFGPHEFAWRLPTVFGAGLLAASCAVFAGLWFDRCDRSEPSRPPIAAWAAGLSTLALVTLWDQSRDANIDLLNTAFTTLAVLLMLHLLQRSTRLAAIGIAVLSLIVGGMFLLKGPVGLLVVMPAMIAGAILFRAGWRRGGAVALGLVGGLGIFLGWVLWAKLTILARGWELDTSGAAEGWRNMHANNLRDLLNSMLTPAKLLAHGLPTTLFLLAVRHKLVWPAFDPRQRMRIDALLWTLAGGGVLLLISGTTNVRYGFGLLPLTAVLAGAAVAGAWRSEGIARRRIEWSIVGAAIAICAFGTVCVALAWRDPITHLIGPLAAILSAAAVVAVVHAVRARSAGQLVGALSAMLVFAALPDTRLFVLKKTDRSAASLADDLQAVVPRDTTLIAGHAVFSKPELFWYAHTPMHVPGLRRIDPLEVDPGSYVVLTEDELPTWKHDVPPECLTTIAHLTVDHVDLYIVRYCFE